MVTYPIRIRREYYQGRDKTKRDRLSHYNSQAAELERYINDLLLKQEAPIEVYDFADIASGIGFPLEFVSAAGSSIDGGGSNGFTAWRHDMTYDAAMAAIKKAQAE